MRYKTIIFIFFLLPLLGFSQIGGQATYQFLNLVHSPRQAALGGKIITNYDYDSAQALFNPASINAAMDNQLSLNYSSHLGGISFGSASYSYLFDQRTRVFNTGVTYVNYGNFQGYDALGNPTQSFSGSEVALSVGHARNVAFTNFHLGGNLKLISSRLEQYSSFGVAVDIAAMYIYERWNLHIAAVARNLGTQITPYEDTYERLPFELLFGLSQTLQNVPIRWHLTFENLQNWNLAFANSNRDQNNLEGSTTTERINIVDELFRHTIIGLELFPDKGFNIRLGYNFRRGEELRILERRTFSGLNAGFSLKLNKVRFSYAYSRYNAAASTNFFGLHLNLQ